MGSKRSRRPRFGLCKIYLVVEKQGSPHLDYQNLHRYYIQHPLPNSIYRASNCTIRFIRTLYSARHLH